MKFSEAWEHLLAGKAVRRPIWADNAYYKLDGPDKSVVLHNSDGTTHTREDVDIRQMIEPDWELYHSEEIIRRAEAMIEIWYPGGCDLATIKYDSKLWAKFLAMAALK